MTLSPQLTTIFVGALAVLIGTCLAFGHRYSDRSEKLAGNTSELNEIKSNLRSEITVPVIDKIWRYILQTDGAMRDEGFLDGSLDLKSGNVLDTRSLLFDTNRRGYFNMLINELERTFKDSSTVDTLWLSLKSYYTQIGQALYLLAAIVGLGGYGLMLLAFYPIASLSFNEMNLLTAGIVILALVTLIIIIMAYQKAKSNLRVYEDDKRKYVDGITRVQ
jgi:hypothetical protein